MKIIRQLRESLGDVWWFFIASLLLFALSLALKTTAMFMW